MDNITALGELFRDMWSIFSIEHPVLGISFGSIVIGFFVICFAITLLRPLLGIGAGVFTSVTSAGRNVRNRSVSRVKEYDRRTAYEVAKARRSKK